MSTKKIGISQTAQNAQFSTPGILCSPTKAMIGDYQTAPLYMKDNVHITHGYRINFNNPKKIFRSLFMLHNESVNIWTHFVPAIVICAIIISFAMIVDHNEIIVNLNNYQKDLSNSFQHYTQALDNLTLIENMKDMKEKTQIELQQLRHNTMQSFDNFVSKFNSMQNLSSLINLKELRESLKLNFDENMERLKNLKNDYQTTLAPALLDHFSALNNSYIARIKDQVSTWKQQIDKNVYLDIQSTPNPNSVSKWPLMAFLASALFALLCSALFHLFYPMSSFSYIVFSRFDYAGISLLIAGSAFPPLYYGMYCYLEVATIYLSVILTLAVAIFVLSLFEWMHRPENSLFKALIYIGFGMVNVIAVVHLIINDKYFDNGDGFEFNSSQPYYAVVAMVYLLGIIIYTIRCPERHFPGKFNLCGHSHQIWHLLVVAGVIFTYLGALENFQMRKQHSCPVINPFTSQDSIGI